MNSCIDRYALICDFNLHDTINNKSSDYVSSGGGKQVCTYSTIDAPKSLCDGFNFIDTWLKKLETNYVRHVQAYYDKMKEGLKNITNKKTEQPPEDNKKKCKMLMTNIGGQWYSEKLRIPHFHQKIHV